MGVLRSAAQQAGYGKRDLQAGYDVMWFKGCDVAHDASTSFTAVLRAAVVAAAAAAASERVRLGERPLGCIVMGSGWCPRNLL